MNTNTKSSFSFEGRLLRIKDVTSLIGLKRSTIYDRMNPASNRYDCSFPKPIKIGKRAIAWLENEVKDWISMQADMRGYK